MSNVYRLPPPLDMRLAALSTDLAVLVKAIENLTGEMIGLRVELQAQRERWEAGAETS